MAAVRRRLWLDTGPIELLRPAVLPSARGGSLLERMPIRFALKLSDNVDLATLGTRGLVIVAVTSVWIDAGAVAI